MLLVAFDCAYPGNSYLNPYFILLKAKNSFYFNKIKNKIICMKVLVGSFLSC